MANQPTMLIEDLHAYYGASHVLQGVNLSLSGAGVSLVGRNGMGKTTLVRTIMGLVPARGGSVRFKGREITRLRPHEIASLGIGYVPQGRRLFPSLSVLEHLILCARPGNGAGRGVEKVFAMFPRLADRAHSSGTALSGGEQQMLAIARALVTNPELLIMDEPSEGLAPVILDQLIAAYRALVDSGVSFLLVEQNLRTAVAFADQLHVMVSGRIVDKVDGERLMNDQALRENYLGVSTDRAAAQVKRPGT